MTLNPLTALRSLFAYIRSSREQQTPAQVVGMTDKKRREKFEQRPDLRTMPPGSTNKDGYTPHPM